MSRTLKEIAASLADAIAQADAAVVPLNLHTSVLELSEFATAVAEQDASAGDEAIAALSAKVDALHDVLVQAGVLPEPKPETTEQPQG